MQYDTKITSENFNKKKWTLKVCENKSRWSSEMKEIWNEKIVQINDCKQKE